MNTDSTIVNADSKKFSFFVHLRVESAFTIIWNWRSRSLGISVHDRVEYALKAENHPEQYWQRAHDGLFYLNVDYFGPKPCYEWLEHRNKSILTLFFLTHRQAISLEKKLQNYHLTPKLYFHEKQIEKYEQKDKLFHSLFTLTCQVPYALQETVMAALVKMGYERIFSLPHQSAFTALSPARQLDVQVIDLKLIYGSSVYMTLSFYIDVPPNSVQQALHHQLNYPKTPEVIEHHLIYFLSLRCVQRVQAIEEARQQIIDFIRVIKSSLASSTTYYQAYPKRTTFFQPSLVDALCKKYKLPDQRPASLEKGLRNAAANRQLADIKLFLQSDIDINAVDERQSRTALFWAVSKGYEECADYLRAHGAQDEPLKTTLNA